MKTVKTNTIKWRILKYNIIIIICFMVLTIIVFNIAIKLYIENDISHQLENIAMRAEETALRRGPDFLPNKDTPPPDQNNNSKKSDSHLPSNPPNDSPSGPPHNPPNNFQSDISSNSTIDSNKIFEFYFMIDRSLRETLSVLNADYILLDSDKEIINTNNDGYFSLPKNLMNKINDELLKNGNSTTEYNLNFNLSGTDYIAIVKSVSNKNSFGLGWIVIFSSLKKVKQLQWVINLILLIILIIASLIVVLFSSNAAKKISAPFSSLSQHLAEIAERNFYVKLDLPVDDELKDVVKNINVMAEKLETYDKAQQTFLQNASHEFRTPLMSIQSYAEGIKYDVIDSDTAVAVILEETKRMTNLVEDLIYLSRLDTIEESYRFNRYSISNLIVSCIDRMNGIANKNNINIVFDDSTDSVYVLADEEKLSRAITNIITNDIRYATSMVKIILKISNNDEGFIHLSILDDGSGFDPKELPNIFDRFYKGKKGNFGLGLAIAKNVIEKHNGSISAENTDSGALFIIELPVVK